MKFNSHILREWFLKNKRALPWRENASPYGVWVSEVMLQQTQANVVIPYFIKWMKKFPTIETLANASLDDVIKAWEGLGYYSRARNLHAGAKQVYRDFKGELPSTPEELLKIKGIGPYTLGAILSFAFHQKAEAVDGNVIRVLCRYFNISEDISKTKTIAKLREIAKQILPDSEPWIIVEALIELGALICTKKPQCNTCPLKGSCKAYALGNETTLPYKSSKIVITHLNRKVAVILSQEHLLVKKGCEGQIMSDLYEFPYTEEDEFKEFSGLNLKLNKFFPNFSQSFTRYRVQLEPIFYETTELKLIENYQWIPIDQLKKLAFSSGHRKIFNYFCEFAS